MIAADSKVKIHCTLKVNGKIIDTSIVRDPLEYQQGQGMLVPGVKAGLEGAKPGDKKKFAISTKNGCGETDPELILTTPREAFAQMPDLQVGATVKLDLNHPLADKTLDFDIEAVAAEPPPSTIIRT